MPSETQIKPEMIYLGTREAMLAEVSAWDPMQIGVKAKDCKYLVMPHGAVEWTTEFTGSKAEAKTIAKDTAKHYGIEFFWAW